jgi:TetR/AcrR family transcriptional regulator
MSQPGKKQLLLDAAQKRFAYYGISKVTMAEIAADVGLSKAAIYYYFKTKEEIFKEVVVREIEQFSGEMKNEIDAQTTAAEKLSVFIQSRFKAAERMHNFKKASIDAGVDLRTHMGDMFVEYRRREHLLIVGILKAGVSSGEFTISSPKKTAALLQHIIFGLISARSRPQLYAVSDSEAPETSHEEENVMLADLIVKGLTAQ